MSILNEIYPSHLIDKRHISAKLSNAVKGQYGLSSKGQMNVSPSTK